MVRRHPGSAGTTASGAHARRLPSTGAARHRFGLGWLRVAALATLALPVVIWAGLQTTRSLLGEVRVNGQPIAVSRAGANELRQRARHWEETPVAIRTGPYISRLTRLQLGTRLPVTRTIERLQSVGRSGNPLRDLTDLWTTHNGGLELIARPEVDVGQVSAAAMRLRERVERAPVPGTRTPEGEIIDGIPGLTINTLTAVDLLVRGLRAGDELIALEFSAIAPPRPIAYDAPGISLFSHEMSVFETDYRIQGDAWGRAANIETAAEALDGRVIPPGGVLSFNSTVGERSFERGFRPAKELANRRVVDGIGGGVCQVAATLHAAAFLGGFKIPTYQPHSRPARYVETGLDTMVAWPNRDLEIQNPYPFSVRLDVRAQGGTVRVSMMGAGKAHPVEWSKELLERIPARERVEQDPSVPAGERRVVQDPIDGMTLRRTRTIYLPTGPVVDELVIRYPPNDRIVAVGG